jgi:hypothetical protein
MEKFSVGFQEIPTSCWVLFGIPGFLGFVFTGNPIRMENALFSSQTL